MSGKSKKSKHKAHKADRAQEDGQRSNMNVEASFAKTKSGASIAAASETR